MSSASETPTLRANLADIDQIPADLRAQRRWAPWRAVWSERRGKWDKIPCLPSGYGLSTARPERWLDFDTARAAVEAQPDTFAGVGYVMTGPHGVVGIDLDHCVGPDGLAPWAADLVAAVGSYAELSPSGTGVRVMARADDDDVPADWTNHEQGVEVYAGHEPRFLTITGARLPGAPIGVAQAVPGVLPDLAQRYARERTAPTADVISLRQPEVLDELLLPDLQALDLPWQARDFLLDGTSRGDRSRELFAASVALYRCGLSDDEVFSLLAHSPHAMGTALDHRRQDPERAALYLWTQHCAKARQRAASSPVAGADDFDDVSEPTNPTGTTPTAQAAEAPRKRFTFQQWAAYAQRKPAEWLVQGVLPQAELGVIYGASTAGKSFFAIDLLASLARGVPWRGKPVRQGAVAYVCAEGAGGFAMRLRAYHQYHDVDPATLPFFVLGDAPNLMERGDVKDLLDALRELPPLAVIVVDTLAQTTPGANENSGEDMGRALGHCRALHKATGALVLLVGHAGKDAERGHRGWSGIKGALDVEIQVEREGQHRAATITKLKDGMGEGDEYPFHLGSVHIGEDDEGDPITSCVALPGPADGQPLKPKTPPRGANQKLLMRVLQTLTDLAGPPTVNALLEAAMVEMPEEATRKAHKARGNLLRALKSLEEEGAVCTAGGQVNPQ